ncbi:MAG: hypothetical protein M3Y69_08425 [Verrucomicrobiota bacterium]|nr:hypothetical protein [Verrucomicrobiota bacterium]
MQSGDDVLIGGLVISGDKPKRVLLRAIGPSLTAFGVQGALRDPFLAIHNSAGTMIAWNDSWRAYESAVDPLGKAPGDDAECAIVTSLAPGAYTAVLSGSGGSQGVALVEFYDLEPDNGYIASISTRSKVGTGDAVMIGGFAISGTQSAKVLVRAIGPSLEAFGVTGLLADPVLELYNADGSRIFVNDNWASDQKDQIIASSLAPGDPREAAIVATLPPGAYTAVVRGADNTSGVALVEVYYAGP